MAGMAALAKACEASELSAGVHSLSRRCDIQRSNNLIGERQKLQWSVEAIARGESFFCELTLKENPLQSLHWQANRSDEEIMSMRNEVIEALEFAAGEQRSSGLLEAWFGSCEGHVRQVAALSCCRVVSCVACIWIGCRGVPGSVDGPVGNCDRVSRQGVCQFL